MAMTLNLQRCALLLTTISLSSLALGTEPPSVDALDDMLSGFEDESAFLVTDTSEMDIAEDSTRDNWQITTDINFTAVYSYNRNKPPPGRTGFAKLSQLRIRVRPELWFRLSDNWDGKISLSSFYDGAYELEGRGDFTPQLLNESESETEFRDTYLRGKLAANLDVKLGKQIVVWGKSDNLRVVDVLNPLDLREPGQVDIEDLRIPLNMAKLDYYFGSWSLSAIAIPEIRFDKTPAFGSEFYPATVLLPQEDEISDGGSNTEYALALNGRFQGWDLAFHLARVFNDRAHLAATTSGLRQQHSRLDMAGISTAVAVGDWLVKGEVAYLDGLAFFSAPGREFSRTDLMMGGEYNGFDDTTLSLETVVRRIDDYDSVLKFEPFPVEEQNVQTAFRYNADFLHKRLNLILLATRFGEGLNEGGFTRVQFKYELKDAVSLTVGNVLYHGGAQAPFDLISQNDRLFVDLKYSF